MQFYFNKFSISLFNSILPTFQSDKNGSKGKIPNFFVKKITQRNYR